MERLVAAVTTTSTAAGTAVPAAGTGAGDDPTPSRRASRRRQEQHRVGLARLPLVMSAGLAVAVAGWGFSRVLGPEAAVLPVLLGAFGPALLLAVLCAARPRRTPAPPSLTLPLSLLVLGVGGPVLVSATTAGPGALESLRSFGGTWRTLLLSTLPASADSAAVLAVLVVVWVAGALAAEAALRSRVVALGLVPSVVVLAVAVALGLPAAGNGLVLAAVLAGVAAAHLALSRVVPEPGSRTPPAPPPPDRVSAALRLGTVLLVGTLAAGAGLLAGPRLPFVADRPPFDPRSLVEAAQDTSSGLTPLSRVTQWLASPPSPLFAVEGDLAPQDHLRQVSLGSYDGTTWASDEGYVVAGTQLPEPDPGLPTRELSVRVAVGALPGPWLPAPARATRTQGVVAKVAPGTGDLVTAGQPLAGAVYEVTSAVPDVDQAGLVGAGTGSGAELEPLRDLPDGLPESVAETARTATAAGGTPIERMLLLERWMRENLTYDPAALPGHSYGVLERFVEPGSAGTMEQFAAAYAVMARDLGLASRVTVAFTPGTAAADPVRSAPVEGQVPVQQAGEPGSDTPGVDDGVLRDPGSLLAGDAVTVTTRDALAYPEVWLDGAGWVPFFPVPLPGAAAEQEVLSGVGAPPDRVDLQDVTAGAQDGADAAEPELEQSLPERGLPGQLLLGAAAAAGALAAWLAVVAVWTALARRRRRTAGGAPEQLLGAWQHVLAALEVAGVSRVRTLTSEQVVDRGRLVVEPGSVPALTSVAGAARRTLFSTHPVTPDDVTAAWADADAVTRSARRGRGRLARLLDLAVPPRR